MDAVLEKEGRNAAKKEADFALLCAWAGYSVTLGEYFAKGETPDVGTPEYEAEQSNCDPGAGEGYAG